MILDGFGAPCYRVSRSNFPEAKSSEFLKLKRGLKLEYRSGANFQFRFYVEEPWILETASISEERSIKMEE